MFQRSTKNFKNPLFAVTEPNFDTEFLVDVLGEMLRRIDGTMLTARAAKREHQRGKTTLQIAFDVGVGEFVNAFEKGRDFAVVFEEANHGFVESSELFVGFVTAWVVGRATVENVTTTVAAFVFGNAFFVGKTEHADDQRLFFGRFRRFRNGFDGWL